MKNKLLVFFTILLLFTNVKVFSVDVPKDNGWCASVAPDMEWEAQIQRIIQTQQAQHSATGRVQQVAYTIPVIVHICYYQNNVSQNIPAARVQSQITTLNNDFAGTGVNSGTLPAPFAAVKANSNITFCLAKLDLNNNILAEPGIERINGQARGWGNPGSTTGWSRDFIDNTIKRTTIWDPNFYLNIWVVPYIGGLTSSILGYATFPSMTGLVGMPTGAGNELNDGFVCKASYFGTTGGNIGRTSTHEIGHWLGLRHIWGDDGQCNADDFCNDTPKQYGGTAAPAGCNYGCPTYPFNANLCNGNPNGDMFMNFMDYTNDGCMALFTNDQSARFQATMQFGDFRKNMPNSPVCDTVLQKPFAKFTSLKQNAALCATSQKYDFTDKSLFKPTSWSWTFQGGSPATSTVQNPPNITFTTRGLHDVTLTVTNARGTHTATYQINVPIVGTSTLPLNEDFESPLFPPLGWDIVNRNGNPAINWDFINGYSGFGVGNRCMRFDNTSLDGQFKKDDIMTSKFDLTGATAAKLKFDIAYTPFFGDAGSGVDEFLWDTLEVLITDNCQTTTQRIYRRGETDLATVPEGYGPEFYPAANQWRTDSVVIPAAYLNKPNIQIIFRNYGNYGHTIYIDNINVSTPNTSPTATASFTASDTVVCAGGSLTFTNTSTASVGSPDSVRWTIPGGVPGTSTSATTVSPVFSTAGTYVVSLIAYKSGNASVVATKSIRVKPLPTVNVTSPTICSGQTANPTVSSGTGIPATTFSWTGGLSPVSNPITPILTTTTTYTVTGTREGCTATAVSTVTVNPSPTTSVGTPSAICSGSAASLTATGATSYTWSPNIGTTATVSTGVLTTTTTYTVTGTTGTCTKTATVTVTVTPLPNVTVNSPSVCSGGTASLNANGATSYTWSPNIGGTASVTTPPLTTTTTYTVTGTASGCTKTAVSTVTVTAPPVVTINSVSPICSGSSASLTANGATSYTWSPNIGSTATVSTGTLTTTTTYTVTGTTGCSATASVTVVVNPSPTVTINAVSPICSGSTASLTANGASTYSWSPNIGGTASVTTPPLTTTTTYTVTGTASGCTGTATATVIVNALPNVTVSSPSICSGSTASITANGASTYTWSPNIGSGATVTTPTLTTTTTYTVTGKGNGTCTKSAVSTVTVTSSAPTVTITPNPASVCIGDQITLTANGANSYTWTTPSGNTNGSTLALSPTSDIDVLLSGTVSGCTTPGTTSITVTVKGKPTVGASSTSICSGQTASLTANGANTYAWSPNIGSGASVTTPALTTTTNYTVTGTGNNGCTNTAVSTVTVGPVPATPTITQNSLSDTLYSSSIVAGATYEWYKSNVLTATTSTPYYVITSSGQYTVKVISLGCSSVVSANYNAVFTAIRTNSNSIQLFEVYPNPTDGRLVMNLNLTKSAGVQIHIYTPEGKEMYMKAFTSTRNVNEELNLNDFAKGIYIIKLRVDDETFYHKVVKQ